jgi:hypothetical protein
MLKQVQHDIFHHFDITTQSPRGEGRPFIPPAELGGILEYFDKFKDKNLIFLPQSVRCSNKIK